MTETTNDPPDIDSKSAGEQPNANGYFDQSISSKPDGNLIPLTETRQETSDATNDRGNALEAKDGDVLATKPNGPEHAGYSKAGSGQLGNPLPAQDEGPGSVIAAEQEPEKNSSKKKRTVMEEIKRSFWLVVKYSWFNILLVFVPVGIIVANVGHINAGIIFGMNCVAIIPLAGLLAFSTESVASSMGDALGALLNVTFGNAVELIIFIIALVKNEIRIVQASLLGSILANLLLILGMGFFMGGMRYREQLYNSTVTQMSACLLSLSVTSLVLPTAFYASFQDQKMAQKQSIKVSRGTSVILLLVYIIYLLFQLKSHAYLYESTPQHIVDAESTPGPAAGWLDTSSDDSSSSSSDSDSSGHSHDTVRRKMKKVLRGGRRRKSSVASVDTTELNFLKSSAHGTANASPQEDPASESSSAHPPFPRMASGNGVDEADEEDKPTRHSRRHRMRRHRSRRHKRRGNQESDGGDLQPTISERPENVPETQQGSEPRRVDFAVQPELNSAAEGGAESRGAARRPFPALRGVSVRNLAPSVFIQRQDTEEVAAAQTGSVPRVRYGIRRTNSLPDRLTYQQRQLRPPGAMLPSQIPPRALAHGAGTLGEPETIDEEEEQHLSRNASIILLLISTGLVAVCAEFLVASIQDVVETSSVGEIFIGLIILPIVGNAAEHVTALTVAMKNKMDLAIGVAVGSSIQIAIFVTPLVVILGWILDKPMTLHFTLFETVCLFVSAFIVNFLVLDGRSNYLEGALLCAVYLIIAIVAFFYPDTDNASLS